MLLIYKYTSRPLLWSGGEWPGRNGTCCGSDRHTRRYDRRRNDRYRLLISRPMPQKIIEVKQPIIDGNVSGQMVAYGEHKPRAAYRQR